MCQCLVCDCWWCSCCDIACLGVGTHICCFGFWCCKHDQLVAFNDNCCLCCQTSGFGGPLCCIGSVCCAPEWLRHYSNKKSARNKYEE